MAVSPGFLKDSDGVNDRTRTEQNKHAVSDFLEPKWQQNI